MSPTKKYSTRKNSTLTAPFADHDDQVYRERSWERLCTKIYRNSPVKTKQGGVIDFLKVNKNAVASSSSTIDFYRRRMCCCHTSPRNRPRLEVVNEYDRNVKKLRSPLNLSFRSRTAIQTIHTTSVIDHGASSRLSIQSSQVKKSVSKRKKKKSKKGKKQAKPTEQIKI